MSYYRNPTANTAIGTVDREIRLVRKRAEALRRRRQQGLLTPEELAAAWRECPPAHRRLLRRLLGGESPLTTCPTWYSSIHE